MDGNVCVGISGYRCSGRSGRQELELELRDRFGILPQPLEIFMAVLALKQFLSGAQALKADVYEDRLRVLWDEKQNAIAPEKLVPFLSAQKAMPS